MDEARLDGVEAVFREVGAVDLEPLTRAGWRLVQVLRTTTLQGVDVRTVSVPAPYSGGYPTTHSNPHSHYGETPRYLLRKDQSTVMEELNDQLAQAQQAASTALDVQEATEKELVAAKGRITRLEERAQYLSEEATRKDARYNEERARARKMEEDLGKVRKEIGEREWARIFGSG